MQSSHLTAMAMPSAINSLVLTSSALAVDAACAMLENAFMTSGASARKFLSWAVSSLVICGQSFIDPSLRLEIPFTGAGLVSAQYETKHPNEALSSPSRNHLSLI